MITTIAIATIITTDITNIPQGQSLEILLYRVDTWREAALYNGIEVVGRCDNPHIVVKFPAERVDFIAPHLCEIAAIHSAVFGSSQYRVVSELIARGEIGFYLRVLGKLPSCMKFAVSALRFAFICILLHYMIGLVSKSEVMKRTGKCQAFGECLHNVAHIGNEFLTDFR
jgi:hypothetical protein